MGTKVPLPVVAVLLVAAAALGWFVRPERREEPMRSASQATAPGEPVSPAPAIAAAAPSSARVPAPPTVVEVSARSTPEPRRADLATLEARLRELLASGSDDRRAWEKTLRELVDEGSPAAIGLVLEAMQDQRCEFAHSPEFFAKLLEPVDDPRIGTAARAVLERNVENGLSSWNYTWGYVALVAGKDASAGDAIAAWLAHGGQLATGAAQNVWRLEGKASPEPFLAALERPGNMGLLHELADSLARWQDASVRARLVEIASSTDADPRLRTEVLKGIARHTEASGVQDFGRWYWAASDDAGRSVALDALGYLGYATRVDDAELAPVGAPILVDALGSSNRDVWIAAAQTIQDHDEFHTEAVRDALTALLGSVTDEGDQEALRAALAKTESSLRKQQARAASR